MGATYSYLDKELTNKYKNKIIVTNQPVFLSSSLKSILDTNNPWKRFPGYYEKKFPETIPILLHKDQHFTKLKIDKSLILKIKRIEYVTIYTGPDSCRDDREYDIFAKDQYNNIFEISNLFKNLNKVVKPDETNTEPHIKPQYQKFMTGTKNNFMYRMFPVNLECKDGITM